MTAFKKNLNISKLAKTEGGSILRPSNSILFDEYCFKRPVREWSGGDVEVLATVLSLRCVYERGSDFEPV